MEKGSTAIALIRTLASQRILQDFDCNQTIQRSLSREKSGFAPALVMRGKAQEIKSGPATDEPCDPIIGNTFVVLDGCRVLVDGCTVLPISDEQTRRDSAERHQPARVGKPNARGACPDL